ncbi:MAG: nitroreductase family protein [Deltaproteobacteria bacterium]|nr:nitroreductase family protein [Deltaproteobacteria bacterium]
MDYESLLNLVKKRRSIRRFKPDPIPDDDITKIIDVARWAPSGFNMQPWEFLVVKNPDLREKIVELISDIRPLTRRMEQTRETWMGKPWKMTGLTEKDMDYTTAPVYIILLGDPRTNVGLPMFIRYDGSSRQLIYTSGLANAFIYLHLAATTLGLATQWVSATHTGYVQCMIKEMMGIPVNLEIFDMIALGYPSMEPRPKLMRDLKEMIHYDDCGPDGFRTDEEVEAFVKRARNWNIGSHRRKPETH